jgi:hypothetical protein
MICEYTPVGFPRSALVAQTISLQKLEIEIGFDIRQISFTSQMDNQGYSDHHKEDQVKHRFIHGKLAVKSTGF